MDTDIDRVMQRTQRYWYEDGLAEMAGGVLFVAIGLLFYAETRLPGVLGRMGLSALGLPVVVLGGGWLARRAVAAAKSRLTYPRTGYVAYRRVRSHRLLRGAIAGAVSGAVAAFLLALGAGSRAWIPAMQGLLIAAFFLYTGYTLDLGRFHALAVFSAAAGLLAALAGLGDILGSAAYFAALGLAVILSGAWALRGYLRATAPLAREAGDGQ